MYYFGHYHLLDKKEPYSVYGTWLPDIAKMWDRKARTHTEIATSFAASAYEALRYGVNHHIAVDKWFHAHPYFLDLEKQIADEISQKGIARGLYAPIVAEYLIELCIDERLEINNTEVSNLVSQTDPNLVFSFAKDNWNVRIKHLEHEYMQRRINDYRSRDWILEAMMKFDRFLGNRFGFEEEKLNEVIVKTQVNLNLDFIRQFSS